LTGQFAIGHAGFMAVGPIPRQRHYLAMERLTHHSTPHLGWMLLAMLAGGCWQPCSDIVGTPSLRLRGDYLAIVTLGLARLSVSFWEPTTSHQRSTIWRRNRFQNIPSLAKFPLLFGTAMVVIGLSRNLNSHRMAWRLCLFVKTRSLQMRWEWTRHVSK